MNLSFSTRGWPDLTWDEMVKTALEMGFTGIEVYNLPKFEDMLAKYGDRLFMTHLNDNLGVSRYDGTIFWTDDLHLLPYDGIADWNEIGERLKRAARIPALNFELKIDSMPERHENDVYVQMGMEAYFTEAYKRACGVASRVSR